MWVFSIYTMVDGFFVAKYVGETSLSAVNLALPFVNTLFAIAILFATGTATLVGMALGEGKEEQANKLFNITVKMEVLFSVALAILCKLFLSDLVHFLGASTFLFDEVYTYINIILLFSPFFIVSYHFEVLIKTDGFPKLATIGVLLSAVTNIVLDYLFVGLLHMGIAGAAWATGIAQVLSTLMFLYHFIFGASKLKFQKTKMKLSPFAKICSIGFGSFITEFSTGFSIFLYNQYILMLIDHKALISYTVVSYINLFISMTMVGLTQGMQPLVSYYYGKKEVASYRKFLQLTVLTTLFLSLVSYFGILTYSERLISFFISPDEVNLFRATKTALFYFAPSFLIVGFNTVFSGYFAAIGYAREAIVISVSRGFLFIWASLFLTSLTGSERLLWLSAFFCECATLLLSLTMLFLTFKKSSSHNRKDSFNKIPH